MKNIITAGPRDQLPKFAKQAMMAEADFAIIKEYPAVMPANMDGGAEAICQGVGHLARRFRGTDAMRLHCTTNQ